MTSVPIPRSTTTRRRVLVGTIGLVTLSAIGVPALAAAGIGSAHECGANLALIRS